MLVRLRFSEQYPLDFSEEEKRLLIGLIKRISNNKFREYEFDSRRMNLFEFYSLLVDFGFKNVKLELKKNSDIYFMTLSKDIEFKDEVLFEF